VRRLSVSWGPTPATGVAISHCAMSSRPGDYVGGVLLTTLAPVILCVPPTIEALHLEELAACLLGETAVEVPGMGELVEEVVAQLPGSGAALDQVSVSLIADQPDKAAAFALVRRVRHLDGGEGQAGLLESLQRPLQERILERLALG